MNGEEKLRMIDHPRHRGRMLIPAGVLIGLGLGLLTGYPASGILIGLGLGMIGAGIYPCSREHTDSGGEEPGCRPHLFLPVIGLFLIIVGIGITWTPFAFWPTIIALFLILIGISFLFRAFFHRR